MAKVSRKLHQAMLAKKTQVTYLFYIIVYKSSFKNNFNNNFILIAYFNSIYFILITLLF